MSNKKPDGLPPTEQRQAALSTWDDDGGAAPHPSEQTLIPGKTQPAIPQLTNTELIQLRVRVIALENMVITMLAEASDRQLERVREMASYISPRPGTTHHHLTIHAAAQMLNLANRARHFRDAEST
jgi:hypothetical protein